MRCYRCGKPATKFVNTAIGVAVTAASILESACDECWQKSHDATLTAALEEARGALEELRSSTTLHTHDTRRVNDRASERRQIVASAGEPIERARTALATINAALGRVEG